MTLPDVNVFIHAVNDDAREHRPAREWLDQALAGPERVGFAWVAVLGFIRITTRPDMWPQPISVDNAFRLMETWLAAPPVEIIHPGPEHARNLKYLLSKVGTAGNLVTDAHLAALAIENGAELVTFDRDFGRFAGLRWKLLET
jgi:toxin-antitoxin system PIN domain toxin